MITCQYLLEIEKRVKCQGGRDVQESHAATGATGLNYRSFSFNWMIFSISIVVYYL